MSKNVAVFVDVANIFYAAKAAGIDIDYVTLLKSATANRDFVRAYAYTGLDPENENQRQFHAFLARSGYKVVSKDIRKYGDGRVKANLDIELVVDMMRMAEKLDIAIVVSGDGDFAPAIAAVQQKGVRVEVISFRGNTSSDLIDVADVFIDITNVAKVEKGARSGRRIASEGDLSMTEVPDKESGVKPRRRRRSDADDKSERSPRSARTPRRRSGRKTEAEEPEKIETAGTPWPTGRSSGTRGPAWREALAWCRDRRGPEPSPKRQLAAESTDEAAGEEGTGRRRRRRRGGRGRGRGGRGAESADEQRQRGPAQTTTPSPHQHSRTRSRPCRSIPASARCGTARSVSPPTRAPAASAGSVPEDEEFEDEPEVPEYLLSEKKQGRGRGGRGGRSGRSGRSGGYRSAIDRERYGSGGSSYARGSSRGKGRSASTPRASAQSMEPIEQTPGGDPWSEVPPEVQELLMAEVARRETTAARGRGSGRGEAQEDHAQAHHDQEGRPGRGRGCCRGRRGRGSGRGEAQEDHAQAHHDQEGRRGRGGRAAEAELRPRRSPRRPRASARPRRPPRRGRPSRPRRSRRGEAQEDHAQAHDQEGRCRPRPRRLPRRPSLRPWTVPPSPPCPAAPS